MDIGIVPDSNTTTDSSTPYHDPRGVFEIPHRVVILVDKLSSWEENQGFSDIGRKERIEGLRRQYTHRIKG